MPLYRIKHITRYCYASTVIDCANHIMLYPIDDNKQHVIHHNIVISTNPMVETFTDYFGNTIGIFFIINPVNQISIESTIEVETFPVEISLPQESPAKQWEMLHEMSNQLPYLDFITTEIFEDHEAVKAKLKELVNYSCSPFENAQILSKYIFDHFEYDKSVTSVETKIDEVWKMKAGVCQDFAHMLLVMLRMAGLPARYVSGYICPQNHEYRGEGATHAWVEVCIPSAGWVGLDPTNNCLVNDRHVRLAAGRSFNDCTPVKGTYKGSSEHTLEVSVSIENSLFNNEHQPSEAPAVFSYQSKNPSSENNSYRKFMEVQQQQ